MNCKECGQELPQGSRFCNGCGAPSPVAVETARVGTLRSPANELEEEHEVFELRPTMIFVMLRYAVAALIVIVMAALMGWLHSRWQEYVSDQVALIVLIAIGLVAFAMPVYQHILRRREVYTLTNHKLEMRFGLIAKNLRNIPLDKIQDVTVTSSVWQRLLGLGDIIIDSASETGKIHLDDIHKPERYADMILAALRRRN